MIVDSKSCVSGAGRSLKLPYLFVEANENMSPYSVGYRHRHIAEMELVLDGAGDYPTALPLYLHTASAADQSRHSQHDVRQRAAGSQPRRYTRPVLHTYAGEPFVQVLPPDQLATVRHVANSNRCAISITPANPDDVDGPDYIIVATIDNLVKGASGQAIQCFNMAAGLPETMGLI